MSIIYQHRTRGRDVEGVHIGSTIHAFEELGYMVRVVSPFGTRIKPGENKVQYEQGINWKVILQKMPTIVFDLLSIAYNINTYSSVLRIVKGEKVDLIYERYAEYSYSSSFIAHCHRIPHVIELNSAGGLKETRVKKLWFPRLAMALEKKVFERAHRIIVVSGYIKKYLIEKGVAEDKILVLHNAADLKLFDRNISPDSMREHLGLNNNTIVGYTGAFHSWHGLDLLVNAFCDMAAHLSNVKLLLVGDGPDYKVIQRLVKEKGMEDNVIFTGRVPHNQIPSYVAAMDITVMPDLTDYNSPVKIFEYMAMGKPVIAASYPPTREIITDKVTGCLFTPRHQEELVQLLCTLATDQSLRQSLGANALRQVEERHTWIKNAEQILNFSGMT